MRMPAAPAPLPATAPSGAAEAVTGDGALYALLTLLVWGLTAPLRGMWQDDATLLSFALIHRGQGLAGLFASPQGPLRRLCALPFFLAQATPHPVLALQLLYGAFWVGQALAAGG